MAVDRTYAAENAAERARLRALVARLSDEELARPMYAGWTVSAMLAHLAFWDRMGLVLLERWKRQGVEFVPLHADTVNDALRALCLALPPRVAAQMALDAAEAIDRGLEEIDLEMVARIEAGRARSLRRAIHRREHLDEIEEALR